MEKQTEKVENTPIQIQPRQVPHFQRVQKILTHSYSYLDVSPFGAGKTHISFATAATYGLKMLVVCPKTAISNWKKWSKAYGVELVYILNYESLRGVTGHQLNHPLLKKMEGNDIVTEYLPTEQYREWVQEGILLVFDEVHMVKNENFQLAAAHALVVELVKLVRCGYKSRIALLSATPADKKETVTSIIKMLGIIISKKLYNYNRSTRQYEPLGLAEAIHTCKNYNQDETLHITCRPLNKTTAKTICHELYTRVLKRHITSSMPPPAMDIEKDCKNFYMKMLPDELLLLEAAMKLFSHATDFKLDTQEVHLSGAKWGDIIKSRTEIDSAKLPAMVRAARKELDANPNAQVVIYCNYIRDIKKAEQLLAEFKPLLLYGVTSQTDRADIVKKFQADDNEYRVIISHPKVGGQSIDLDDVYGNRPRFTMILPSYHFTDQYQATGRIHRLNTKSKATVRFIYSKDFPFETGILNSMATKSKVARDMVTDEQRSILFPGEYDELIEETEETDESDEHDNE